MQFEISSRSSKIEALPQLGQASEAENHCARESILGSENCRNYGTGAAAPDRPRGALSRPPYRYDSTASWVVLAGCFYVQCFLNYLTPCFGVFFGQKLKAFPNSSQIQSSLFTLHILLWDVGSVLSPAIVTNLGHRGTCLLALCATSISFILMAFIDGPEVLYLAYGIISALSAGFLFNTTILILPLYFEKYRRPAFACLTAGMALSGVITPRLVRHLIDFYGYSGGLLLYGGCLLQACVFLVLFEPQRKFPVEITEEQENLTSYVPPEMKNKFQLEDQQICCCNENLGIKLRTWFRHRYLAMKNKRVLFMALGSSFFHSSAFNFYAFIPFLLEGYGYSAEFSAEWISNSAIMSLIGRLFITFTVNYHWLHKRCLLIISLLMAFGTNVGLIVAIQREKILTGLSLFYGLGIGLFFSTFYASLIDVVGLPLYADSLALNALVLAVCDGLLSAMLGLIEDLSGSYLTVLGVCAVMQFAAAALLASLFCLLKLKK